MISAASLKLVQGCASSETKLMDKEKEKVSLGSLSLMTGFPTEFIKSELIIEGEDISISNLRKTMINFLEKNKNILN